LANQFSYRYLLAAVILTGVLVFGACRFAPQTTATPAEPGAASPSAPASASDDSEIPTAAPPDKPVEVPESVPEELKTVWEVWSLLNTEHVDRDKIDPKVFTEAAIRGMLEALDDAHTNYVPPEAFNIENEDLLGRFEGIGANVSMTADGKLVIVAPISGSPAESAGIRPGDVILEVDGESIDGLSLLEAVNKIRGPRGSKVELLVQHLSSPDPVRIEVERGVIPLESVLLRSEPGDEIAHIRLTNFYTDTADKLARTIDDAVNAGAKGIIIDVRDNPGGLLSSVVDVTSLFLEDGLVLYEVDGNGRRTYWEVRRTGGVAEDVPMVVLANEFSASASEILVGALQDHHRATIIGETTFGKGSVNVLRELGNDGGLFLTFARWFTPTGRMIQGHGLEPDIMVTDRDARTEDTLQLEKAFDVIEAQVRANASGNIGS
jgi:carboxyl-terminal processing protease